MNHIINITKVSDRIISISINSNPTITIASVYAPTEAANKETKTVFYNNLCNFASLIPQHNFLLISGDFNAHIGFDSHILSPKIIGKNTFYKETNNNGKKLVSFCQFESLIPAQLKFIHKQARTYTWTHPNGALAQLDFILVRNKWKNSVTNCRAYNKIEIGSDHRICIAKIRISLRTTKIIKNIRPIIDWKSVTENQIIQNNFKIELSNKFAILNTCDNKKSAQEQYDDFVECIINASNYLPKISTKKNKPWVSQTSMNIKQDRDKAKLNFLNNNTNHNKLKWNKLSLDLNNSYKKDKQDFYNNICKELHEANNKNDIRCVFQKVRILANKSKYKANYFSKNDNFDIDDKNNNICEDWRKFFDNLLNIKSDTPYKINSIVPAINDLPINTNNFTYKELETVIKSFKNNKAAGIDKIQIETLKFADEATLIKLLKIINNVFNNGNPPTQWTTNIIIPIHKKGSINDKNNYRGGHILNVDCFKNL